MLLKIVGLALWTACVDSYVIQQGWKKTQPFNCDVNADQKVKEDSEVGLRSFVLQNSKHWPFGIVPYTIDQAFSPIQVSMIEEGIQKFSEVSCVKWVPRRDQNDYVAFVSHREPGKCSSRVGRVGGKQIIYFGVNCFDKNAGYQGAIAHEMMHALGFIHEQQRIDRDCYVKVAQNVINVKPFDYGIRSETSLDFPYDFNSIMHYGESDSLNSHRGEFVGHQGELTEMDKMKLKHMYCKGPTFCQAYQNECRVFQQAKEQCLGK